MAICVSRILLDGLQKKERLLVVYRREELMTIFLCCLCWLIINKPLYSAGDTSIQGTLAMVPRVSPTYNVWYVFVLAGFASLLLCIREETSPEVGGRFKGVAMLVDNFELNP